QEPSAAVTSSMAISCVADICEAFETFSNSINRSAMRGGSTITLENRHSSTVWSPSATEHRLRSSPRRSGMQRSRRHEAPKKTIAEMLAFGGPIDQAAENAFRREIALNKVLDR